MAEHPRVWTWRIEEGLCFGTYVSRADLERDGKPSPEAKAVCVRLVPEGDYRKMRRPANG